MLEQGVCAPIDVMTLPTGREATYRNVIEGPRWANFPGALRDLVWQHPELKLKIETDKGWLREIVRFELSGPEHLVRWAAAALQKGIDDWNSK